MIATKTSDGFFAEVKELPHCHTQAKTFHELVEMVNDAVLTYFDVPERYKGKLGLVYLPERIVKELKRLELQKACQELGKEIIASKSTFLATRFQH